MEAIILKCRPNSQFHFGEVAVDADTSLNDSAEILHSDTLFSALIKTAVKVYPDDVASFVELFGYNSETNHIKVSSAYFCLENKAGALLYFLPKPLNAQFRNRDNYKDLKGIHYISKAVWESGLSPDDWFDNSKCHIVQQKFVITNSEKSAFQLNAPNLELFRLSPSPKVSLHKVSRKDSFYHLTNIQLCHLEETKVHLYFLLSLDSSIDATLLKKLYAIIRMLPAEGIGGERSSGCGTFDSIDREGFNVNVKGTDVEQVAVSLINPKDIQEFQQFTQFNVIPRGGRDTGNDGELKRLNMLVEGSVAKTQAKGRILDISVTSNPYLRNGMALTLPYSISNHG